MVPSHPQKLFFNFALAVIVVIAFCHYSLFPLAVWATEEVISPAVSQRVAQALAGRQVDALAKWPGGTPKGLRDIYRDSVSAVPLIITQNSIGSSVVVHIDRQKSIAFVATNHHVTASAFVDEQTRRPYVILIFYEPEFAATAFDESRVLQCLAKTESSASCVTLRAVTKVGIVVASDVNRDLALLAVRNLPPSTRPIPLGKLDAVKPGDEVIVIGHPLGLLWSITTGIVSGLRTNFPISGSSVESTVVQTQTPINPGNSGGPLLTSEGRLIGVIFGSPTVSASRQNPQQDVRVAASGLNLAVGVNEVERFIARRAGDSQ